MIKRWTRSVQLLVLLVLMTASCWWKSSINSIHSNRSNDLDSNVLCISLLLVAMPGPLKCISATLLDTDELPAIRRLGELRKDAQQGVAE